MFKFVTVTPGMEPPFVRQHCPAIRVYVNTKLTSAYLTAAIARRKYKMASATSTTVTSDASAGKGLQNGQTGSVEGKAGVPPPLKQEVKVIALNSFGGLRSVKVENRPEPSMEKGQVLIRVKATGVNFLDLMSRQGILDNSPKLPAVMGFELAGDVEAFVTGAGVQSDFKPGDRVIAFTDYNAWAELVCVSTDHIFKMPAHMSYEEGASMLSYVTAYLLLFNLGGLQKGQSLLVHSAGGSVGLAVSQLVRTVENVKLIGTASQHKHEHIKHGFDHLYDHSEDYVQEIKKIAPEGVNLVLDCLSGDDTNRGVSLLKPMGKYLLYGSANIVAGETKSFFSLAKSWWQLEKISPFKLCDENKLIGGLNLRQFMFKQNGAKEVHAIMDRLFGLYEKKKIKPVIDSTFAMEDVTDAMKRLHDRKNIGKLLLCPSQVPRVKDTPANGAHSAPNSPPCTQVTQDKDGTTASGSGTQ
ncbi:Synaptic vesicle membrane protein VAT-1-like protein-like [Hypsibius exemplaris]|uniref:Synaptic vesicle membrane protein VAT-1-like protein-like n=1 Tax=Hypsibius exemplaris TaxID=2072580 RepID=A0A9X6NCD5_HYPEX|nr:Synaptic vesicle membrane protein VAT-1-like protein-like [Hypsibius exemplaris]